ncbi:DUF389 domain-containing protein [Salinigranum sp.]|uniref:DUF389 domain-containing protein n=1 Tax=Salinigranum sp. TaxID=1966351 RepID=UPI00356A54AA
MRQVNLRVYQDRQEAVRAVLEEHDLDYVALHDEGDEDEDPGTLFLFPLPSQAVTDVFHDLTDAGVSEDAYTVLANASHAETPRYDEIQEEYSTRVRGLSRRELHSKVLELSWPPITYYVGTVLSALIATAGLLLDSPALIIGAMVVAPQVSSALTTTAGVYHADWEMFVRSAKRQFTGLTGAVVGATVFAWLAQSTGLIPTTMAVGSLEPMGVRLAPTALSSLAALGAGAVGAFGYTTDQSMSLVGVMIAAAIVPAAAAGGIAIAWGSWLVAAGALLLLTANVLAVNVGAIATLFLMGYRPVWFDRTDLRASLPSELRASVAVVALLFVVSAVVTGALVGTHIGYQRGTNEAVDETLAEPAFDDLRLKAVRSQYGGWAGTSPNVSVSVIRTTDERYPSLSGTLQRRIERRTDREVQVTVKYAGTRQESATAGAADGEYLPDRGSALGIDASRQRRASPGSPSSPLVSG